MKRSIVWWGSLLALPLAQAVEAPVRFLVLESWDMPFAQIEKSAGAPPKLVGGIIKDWQEALASELGTTADHVLYSAKRQERAVVERKVDLYCFVSPEWVRKALHSSYDWSPAYMQIEEKLASGRDKPLVNSLAELGNQTLGTVLGYHYDRLDPLFDQGLARKENAPSEGAALRKQLAGRTDYVVVNTLYFSYWQKRDTAIGTLRLSPLSIVSTPLSCARPKYSPVSLQALNAAQSRLVKSRALDTILAKYR